MTSTMTITSKTTHVEGKLGGYSFTVEFGPGPAPDGLTFFDDDSGCITKLKVWFGYTLVAWYERGGWEVLPYTGFDQDATAEVIAKFNYTSA